MDTRGAVDLRVNATQVTPPALTAANQRALGAWSEASFDAWCPNHGGGWARAQITRLLLASALESRLHNTAAGSFGAFGQERDASSTTLRQLCLLTRSHYGQHGQAFEIAVADACNAGVPSVVGPISFTLHEMGLRSAEMPRIVLLGLEKVHPHNRDAFYKTLHDALPPEIRLTTKSVGQPMTVATMLEKISRMSWSALRAAEIGSLPIDGASVARWQSSQMGRADALVYTSDWMTLASLKINPQHVDRDGWKHVPLWITTGPRFVRPQVDSARCPTYVAVLQTDDDAMAAFHAAVGILDDVVLYLGRVRPVRRTRPRDFDVMVSDALTRTLLARADQSIEQILADLHASIHPGVRDMIDPQFTLRAAQATVPVVNNPQAKAAWTQAGNDGRLSTVTDLFGTTKAA